MTMSWPKDMKHYRGDEEEWQSYNSEGRQHISSGGIDLHAG